MKYSLIYIYIYILRFEVHCKCTFKAIQRKNPLQGKSVHGHLGNAFKYSSYVIKWGKTLKTLLAELTFKKHFKSAIKYDINSNINQVLFNFEGRTFTFCICLEHHVKSAN